MTTMVTGWIDITASPYNADPTGVADSTAGITAAINAVTNEQAVVYFPPGTYLIGSGSTQLPTLQSQTTLLGCGVGVTNISFANDAAPVFTTGPTATVIKGMSIQYTANPTAGAIGIFINGSNAVRVEDVVISGAYNGIRITNTAGNIFCSRVNVIGDEYGNAGIVMDGTGSPGNTEVHFTDCTIGGSIVGGYLPYGWQIENVAGVYIASCTTEFCATGISFAAASTTELTFNAEITNSTFQYCSGSACFLGGSGGASGVHNIKFTACRFCSSLDGVSTGLPNMGGNDILFTNCLFQGNTNYGLTLSNIKGLVVTGCGIYGDATAAGAFAGIFLGVVSDAVITGCCITGGSSSATTYYGVQIGPSADGVLVQGCDLQNNAAGPIFVNSSASACRLWDNLGYNPKGYMSETAPSTGVARANPQPLTATVYVAISPTTDTYTVSVGTTGGTLTALPGSPSAVIVGPGQSIEVSWPHGTVSWAWFFE